MKRLFILTAVLALLAGAAKTCGAGTLKEADTQAGHVEINEKDAVRLRDIRVKRLSRKLGPVIGYKAGLANPAVQKKFGVDHPLLGIILKGMLLKDGAELNHDFGTRPMAEGDLLLRVKDDCINEAASKKAALSCLDAALPFIELPDVSLPEDTKPTAAIMVATNVGAKHGVAGAPIAITPDADWEARLSSMEVRIYDGENNLLASGRGEATLGNPLNSVLWIKDELLREGKRLKKGDLLSVGSFTDLISVHAGLKLRAEYSGFLPDGKTASVSIEFK